MSLGKHTLANLAGAVVPMVVALVTVPHYLRYIGVERFGVLAVIWSLLTYFAFVDFGFGRAVTQRLARLTHAPDIERSRVVWTGFVASVVLAALGSIVLYFTATYLLASQFKMSAALRDEATSAAIWLSFALPLVLPSSVFFGALQARLRFYEANFIQMAGNVFAQLVPLSLAMTGRIELSYLVPAVLLARTVTALFLFAQCKRHVPLLGGPSIHVGHLREMWGYGGWITVMNMIGPLLVTIDRLIIAAVSGARYVTHYTVPYDLVSRGTVISGSVSSALFPRAASLSDADGRALTLRAGATLLAVMTPITIAGLMALHPFLVFWVGHDLAQQSWGVGELILLGVWINSIAVPHYSRFLATESPKKVALIYLFEVPVYLLLLWYGIYHWGVVGAAAAWSVRVLLDTGLLLRLNGTLSYTVAMSAPSFILVTVTLGIRFSDLPFPAKISVGALLLSLALYKDRSLYKSIFGRLLLVRTGAA
jgi:O-antigen/teichoic acid export membrane protein